MGDGNGNLPQELVLDILLRLPVKVLSRCKCVSKNWCSLIRSPSFVKRHFESNEDRLLVRQKHDQEGNEDDDDEGGYTFALYVDETVSEYEEPIQLQFPKQVADLFGPLNGVFCVVSNSPCRPLIALLNPALRQFKPLPLVQRIAFTPTTIYNNELGLGLDPLTGDYKLVSILNFFDTNTDGQDDHCVASVWTSDSDSWRILEDVDQIYCCPHALRSLCNTYVNGAYYWLLESININTDVAILAFDMGTDKFREIRVTGCDAQSKQRYLALCGDSLSLLLCDEFGIMDCRSIDVWIMKNEGCWIKSSRVGSLEGICRPLCFWKKNKLLLETNHTMTSFLAQSDVSTQKLKTFEVERAFGGYFFSSWVFVYKESLVSIKGEAGNCKLWDTSSAFVKDFFKA